MVRGIIGAVILALVVACVQPDFKDPQGDFSITYSADWEKTGVVVDEIAKLGSEYQEAFAAIKYVVDARGESHLRNPVPAANFLIKRRSLSPSWSKYSSDRDFLEEWVPSSIRNEPTASNFIDPVEIRQGNMIGLELETTYSENISIRRFFRVHGDTVLEIICSSSKRRWNLERKGCQQLLAAVEISR